MEIANGRNDAVKEDLFGLVINDYTGYFPSQSFGCGKPIGTKPSATYYCSQQHDQLFADALATPDVATQKATLARAAKLQITDVPAIYLFVTGNFKAAGPKIRGVEIASPYAYNFDSTYKLR